MSCTILVIDDDKEFTTIINELLSQESYQVETTTSLPSEKLLNHVDPDVIILDLWLNHQINTSQFAKKIKRQSNQQTHIILTSSDVTVTRYGRNLNLPVLVKPFSLETLLQKISQTLN